MMIKTYCCNNCFYKNNQGNKFLIIKRSPNEIAFQENGHSRRKLERGENIIETLKRGKESRIDIEDNHKVLKRLFIRPDGNKVECALR